MSALRLAGLLRSQARRATATFLAVVQLVTVLASLTEPPAVAGGRLPGGLGAHYAQQSILPSDAGHQGAKHDEATCPACIVRSLHARLEARTPLPITVTEQHTPPLAASATFPRSQQTFSNYSRAPPVVG
jgi:hypothetical protein